MKVYVCFFLARVVRCHHRRRHHRWFVGGSLFLTLFSLSVCKMPPSKRKEDDYFVVWMHTKREDAQEKMIHMFLHSHKTDTISTRREKK